MIQLSIIIINYKSAQLIIDCLRTVYAQTQGIAFEVIIVDNNSQDQSRKLLVDLFPGVIWIEMNYNAGFARANNEGIRRSAGQVVLLLNPDTLVEKQGISHCYELFAGSAYVAAGAQLINADQTPQISGNYIMKGGLNYLLPLPYAGQFIHRIARFFRIAKPNLPFTSVTTEVDWINGAFLMVKKSAIQQAGLMDEDFFLYAEEAEWCSRLKKTGKLCIYGSVQIVHLQGETASRIFNSEGKGYYNLFDLKGLQILLSNLVRIRKEFGVGWFVLHLLLHLLEIPLFFVALLFDKMFTGKRASYTMTQCKGYCKNVIAVCRISPTIIGNRPHFYKVL